MRLIAMIGLLTACSVVKHPVVSNMVERPSGVSFDAVMAGVAVEHEAVTSARWAVPRKGLIDLSDPKAADLPKGKVDMVLPVHVLRHPALGVFVIDTGVSQDRVDGGHGAVRGLVRGFVSSMEPVESLGHIVARQPGPLAGVLLTHAHLDHVLGLVDVPLKTPVYTGVGELDMKDPRAFALRPTYKALFDGRAAVREIGGDGAVSLGPVEGFDLFGDGSVWAIPSPGHTAGSVAYLVRTTYGLALFVGDTSHTKWGWDHGVTPGTYTEDREQNAVSLAGLKALVDAHPEIEVFVGHEEGAVGDKRGPDGGPNGGQDVIR